MTAEQRESEPATAEPRDDENVDETSEDDPVDRPTDAENGADDGYDAHLGDVPDGSGCTEIWEHLSEKRENGQANSESGNDD